MRRPVKQNPTQPEPRPEADRTYEGFSLKSVMWGYRDLFARTIEELYAAGHLGPKQQEVTSQFFALLQQADQSCYDHFLRQFLGALHPGNRWIMDLPGVFSDIVEFASALAEEKLYVGIRFFEALADGGIGRSPSEIRQCLTWLRLLRERDIDLVPAFLGGYGNLRDRMTPTEIERYLEVAMEIHRRNPANGAAFLRGELNSSETYILALTQECRLADVEEKLSALLQALTGTDWYVEGLGQLDSDDILERGTRMVSLAEHVYLPERFRAFPTQDRNRKWYLLAGLVAGAMILERSFAVVHGHESFRTARPLCDGSTLGTNLFVIVEYMRVLRGAMRRWPGARRLIAWGLREELRNAASGTAEKLLVDSLNDEKSSAALPALRGLAEEAVNCFDTAERLKNFDAGIVGRAYPLAASVELRPLGILPDFLFPISYTTPSAEQCIADLKNQARRSVSSDEGESVEGQTVAEEPADGQAEEDEDDKSSVAVYLYDEWDFQQNGYRADFCHVHERTVFATQPTAARPEWLAEAEKVRAVFERLKPDMVRREKRLDDGDAINVDQLVEHLVDRRLCPSPPVRFYEKPLVNHRDLAVLILLDVSGSTGETAEEGQKVLDVEKQAAVLLGHGLAALDDPFSVCGFTSNGPEKCEFFVYKDFADAWERDAVARTLSAWPHSSTRIGPALRHAGTRLAEQPHKQRLVILVTDGKPMDQGYDPNTRYAQHDVRMACEENARRDIHTFAISTEENSLADMEIMFPRKRFVILPDLQDLPRVLPQLYLRLTM